MSIELVPQIGRVPEYTVPLNKSQEERAEDLFKKGIFIDLHLHPLVLPVNLEKLTEYLSHQKFTYGYEGLKHGRWTAIGSMQALAKYRTPTGRGEHPCTYEDMLSELGFLLSDLEKHRDVALRVSRADDIEKAKKEGKIGFIPGLEQLAIENILDRIDIFYGFGIRIAGLTYTHRNFIGDGQIERYDSGLSEFGIGVVERMNEIGMAIDVSHSGYKTSLDAIKFSKDPILFSHAGSYTLVPTPRQRKDDEVIALTEKGGMIGVSAVPNVLSDKPKQGINEVLDHIQYFVKLVGADHVGIGTDTLFGDHVGYHKQFILKAGGQKLLRGLAAPYMEGIESPAEGYNIVRGLIVRGFSDNEILKIMGGNAMQFFRRVIG